MRLVWHKIGRFIWRNVEKDGEYWRKVDAGWSACFDEIRRLKDGI